MPIGLGLVGVGYAARDALVGRGAGITALYLLAVGTGIGTCYPIMNTVSRASSNTDIPGSRCRRCSLGSALGTAVF